jgi:hypothetical protein
MSLPTEVCDPSLRSGVFLVGVIERNKHTAKVVEDPLVCALGCLHWTNTISPFT